MTETWKILLITLLVAVALGCVIGIATGKHAVKKAQAGYKPLLSTKERIIYFLSVLAGAALIICGVFVIPGNQNGEAGEMPPGEMNMIGEGGMMGEGDAAVQMNPGTAGGDAATMEAVENEENAAGDIGDEATDDAVAADGQNTAQADDAEASDVPGEGDTEEPSDEEAATEAPTSSGNTAAAAAPSPPRSSGGGRVVVRGGGTAAATGEVIILN